MATTRPIVLVGDATFEVDKIQEHASVVQFPSSTNGHSQLELLHWVERHIQEATVLYTRAPFRVDGPLLDRAKRLRAVVTIAAGHDNIDSAECAKRGIRVGYAGSCLTEATAELCIGLLLAVSRRIPEAVEIAKKGKWPPNWDPRFMRGKALEGSVVGIFGLGRIGRNVAVKLAMFKPREIIYHNRSQAKTNQNSAADQFRYVSFDDLLRQSDFLLITASVNEESRGRFGWPEFRVMKREAILINVSRGIVVDTEALHKALVEGEIWGAGLDVTCPAPSLFRLIIPFIHSQTAVHLILPLIKPFSSCFAVITPHIGSANEVARNRMMEVGQGNVIAALLGKEMPSEL